MAHGNREILSQMQSLRSSTEIMKDSMNRMNSEARKISETEKSFSEITNNMENSIAHIGEQLDKFA